MLKIRPEKKSDQAAIYKVNKLAFGQDDESRLVDKLRESESYVDGLSMVAEKHGDVIGHVLFTQISIEPRKEDFMALSIAPVAVLPEYQGQGIGSKLIDEGLITCKSRGFKVVIVYGHPEYYPRFGFLQARNKGLESSIPVPDEAFMVLELVPGSLDGVEGTVILPPEFDEFA